jgi:Mycothiol maleylpyruvate isomerase N-terminal domain
MSVIPFDHAAARRELRTLVPRLEALVAGADPCRPVPGLDWTAGQVIAHLTVVARAFTDALRGDGERWTELMPGMPAGTLFRERLAAANSHVLAQLETGRLDGWGDQLAEAYAGLLAAADETAAGPDRESLAPWYGSGFTLPTRTFVALALAESLVHGLDIARATGRKWALPADAARVVLGEVMTQMLPSMVDPATAQGFSGSFGVAIRGGPRFIVAVADLAAQVEPAGTREVDCHMSLAPVPGLLLAYRRIPRWRAVTVGGVGAWGRRPWLTWRFPMLFQRP